MSFLSQAIATVPEETRQIARAAFAKGNRCAHLRDAIGATFDRPLFAPRFPTCGQPSESPWRLAPITVTEFVAELADRQIADAVRARIDRKHTLSPESTDPAGDVSAPREPEAEMNPPNVRAST